MLIGAVLVLAYDSVCDIFGGSVRDKSGWFVLDGKDTRGSGSENEAIGAYEVGEDDKTAACAYWGGEENVEGIVVTGWRATGIFGEVFRLKVHLYDTPSKIRNFASLQMRM